jgi:hypothetical protein
VLSLYAGRAFVAQRSRAARRSGFKGAIVAVDFYQRTSVVSVAKELNSRDR